MGQQLCHQRIAVVGGFAGEQVVERAAEAINVGPRVGVLGAEGLLRGHVIHGAHDGPGAGQFGLGCGIAAGVDPGQAHVENLDRALLVEQQIGGLDVSMDDALPVGEFKPRAACRM